MRVCSRLLWENRQNPYQQEGPTENHKKPADQATEGKGIFVIQPDPNEEQWRAEQRTYWESQLRTARWANYITAFAGMVGVAGLCYIARTLEVTWEQTRAEMSQAKTARETFEATQRSSIVLGLPDGKFVDLVMKENGRQQIVLYLRNYGATTARNVVVDLRVINLFPGRSAMTAKFSPFLEQRTGPVELGPDIPPGFPYKWYSRSMGMVLDQGRSRLRVIGRISYYDEFGSRCEVFAADYESDEQAFSLVGGYPLCDGKSHEMLFCYHGRMMSEAELLSGALTFECTDEGIRVRVEK